MKTLFAKTLLFGGLAGIFGGCENTNSNNKENKSKDPSNYTYNGKIGQDSVIFTRHNTYDHHSNLRVIKPDGREIEYVDKIIDDLKISNVRITKNGERDEYSDDYAIIELDFIDNYPGKIVLEKAQKQFDNYLHKIDSIKKTPGYKDKCEVKDSQGIAQRDTALENSLNQALKDLD